MTDIGPVHHHSAQQRELLKRRTNDLECVAEQPPVERQWFQSASGNGRALEFRAIVGMTGIGPQPNLDGRLPYCRSGSSSMMQASRTSPATSGRVRISVWKLIECNTASRKCPSNLRKPQAAMAEDFR
jgi:hypothetical protein